MRLFASSFQKPPLRIVTDSPTAGAPASASGAPAPAEGADAPAVSEGLDAVLPGAVVPASSRRGVCVVPLPATGIAAGAAEPDADGAASPTVAAGGGAAAFSAHAASARNA